MAMTQEEKIAAIEAHVDHAMSNEGQAETKKIRSTYLEQVKPTYIEQWPNVLCSLSIAQVDVPLTVEEAKAVGSNIMEFGEEFGPRQSITAIESRVNEAVGKFPNGAFIRLGSRSPKDAWHREDLMRVVPVDQITLKNSPLRFMLACSERMYEDLSLAIQNDYQPHIFVRQWMQIEKWQEFRCFMRDRKLVGISQYYYMDGRFKEICDEAECIQWAITSWFESQFRDACHLNDVVFDVIVSMRGQGTVREWGVRLLEINPHFEMTDPCMFNWKNNGADFDGSFRYVKDGYAAESAEV